MNSIDTISSTETSSSILNTLMINSIYTDATISSTIDTTYFSTTSTATFTTSTMSTTASTKSTTTFTMSTTSTTTFTTSTMSTTTFTTSPTSTTTTITTTYLCIGSVAEPQYLEPRCSSGLSLGCCAGGKPNCRYCGFNQFLSIICPNSSTTTTTTLSTVIG